MSAAKMVADSTQAEPADTADGKKRKKKLKKTGKKVSLPEDEDSDLDLKKELQPISAFVKSRASMVEEMFHAVRGASLQRALPDLLKSVPLEELKQLCLEQLEVMSKKRIRRILAGEESANISSSGTEDDTTDEETEPAENACVDRSAASNSGGEDKEEVKAEVEAQPADSTSVHQESLSKPEEAPSHGGFVASFEQVEVKQEPPDSAEEDMEEGGEEADDGEEEEEDEEEDEEEAAENYTSGSEDGELVRREEQSSSSQPTVQVKQEPVSDTEEGGTTSGVMTSQSTGEEEEAGNEDNNDDEDGDEEMEDAEGSLMASVGGEGEAGGGDMVLPSIMMDQMELLELEMRARAIKAMLSSQDEENG